MVKRDDRESTLSRREFTFALAGGAGLAIVGYLTGCRPGPGEGSEDDRPQLAGDLRLERSGDGVRLLRNEALCGEINPVGGDVIELLDGRRTIREIASIVAEGHGIEATEALAARIANFAAELGMAGFLERPFSAMIVYHTEARG
jgi:hypothetical protein